MRARCTNERHVAWDRYGGRGIRVCDRWLNDYDAFFQDMGVCPDGMTLERKDNEGHYSPENCRWATRKEQAKNRQDNQFLEYRGRTQTITEWASELDISTGAIRYRIDRNLPIHEILSPCRRRLIKSPHGTVSRYTNRKCRCNLCRKAWAGYSKQRRAKHREYT